MVKITMRNAFLSALEHLYEIAGQNNTDQPEETVVRGPEEEMLLARREEFLVDDNGVEIANEFVVGWDGIKRFQRVYVYMYIYIHIYTYIYYIYF